ncbi:hypothetical protein GLYMA_18G144200v4 [Glycine max]|uniref:Uncharacterized protein n=1 Tax=Glycine max TaxID=3847 RepID=K7MS41_SOYBN|nr:hypothetical protein JHK86_050219 [Glycine max]KAG4936095.1 hypothetical protein JHK85_051014 [Glycine max]KAG5094692.1 hypothetical protein JHK84_050280 [Glycine max]KAH1154541.1 hypothetical protein GYH30_049993 [Glycine max]KRG99429.1 hypothetical protein GLYMA_18G144200v4 [Glycine max]
MVVINLLSLSYAEVTNSGSLTLEIVQQKKWKELELICKKSHVEIPSREEMNNIINLINSGEIDHYDLLLSMDEQISRSKEEASSRKAIMEKVEKWKLACDEERWLEEYSRRSSQKLETCQMCSYNGQQNARYTHI